VRGRERKSVCSTLQTVCGRVCAREGEEPKTKNALGSTFFNEKHLTRSIVVRFHVDENFKILFLVLLFFRLKPHQVVVRFHLQTSLLLTPRRTRVVAACFVIMKQN
jgi:hypothetical protein